MAYVFTKKGREEVEVDLNDLKQWKDGIVKCHDEKIHYDTVKATHEYLSSFCEATVHQLEQMSGYHNASNVSLNETGKVADRFTHDEDYRLVTLDGETYALTPQQGQIIKYLHQSYLSGTKYVSYHKVFVELELSSKHLSDAFKQKKEAFKALIVKHKDARDLFGLNII